MKSSEVVLVCYQLPLTPPLSLYLRHLLPFSPPQTPPHLHTSSFSHLTHQVELSTLSCALSVAHLELQFPPLLAGDKLGPEIICCYFLRQQLSIRVILPQGTLDNVWRYFWLPQLGEGQLCC